MNLDDALREARGELHKLIMTPNVLNNKYVFETEQDCYSFFEPIWNKIDYKPILPAFIEICYSDYLYFTKVLEIKLRFSSFIKTK